MTVKLAALACAVVTGVIIAGACSSPSSVVTPVPPTPLPSPTVTPLPAPSPTPVPLPTFTPTPEPTPSPTPSEPDMMFRYTDSLARGVPSYLVMDVRLGWEIRDGIELSVVGQNLLDSQHPEWIRPDGVTEVESGVYGMVSWKH